jgi:hypothetical protein
MDDKRTFAAELQPSFVPAERSKRRRQRALHWLTLAVLGIIALTYQQAFGVHSSSSLRSTFSRCGSIKGEENPARVWEKACSHHGDILVKIMLKVFCRLSPARTFLGLPAMVTKSAPSWPYVRSHSSQTSPSNIFCYRFRLTTQIPPALELPLLC